MNRTVRWICISLAVAVIGFLSARRLTTVTLAQSSVQVVPFASQTETFNFESDPKGKLIHRQSIARRSDGSTATVSSVGLVEWGQTTRKVTYPNGLWATIYDAIAVKTSWHMKPVELAAMKERLRNPPRDCVFSNEDNPVYVRDEVILGHTFAMIESLTSAERGTFWRARDLGCEELQFRYESRLPDGTFRRTSEERLVSLQIGEPEPGLFELGSNLREMKPSDAHRLFFQILPIPEDEGTKRMSEQLDTKYLTGSQ